MNFVQSALLKLVQQLEPFVWPPDNQELRPLHLEMVWVGGGHGLPSGIKTRHPVCLLEIVIKFSVGDGKVIEASNEATLRTWSWSLCIAAYLKIMPVWKWCWVWFLGCSRWGCCSSRGVVVWDWCETKGWNRGSYKQRLGYKMAGLVEARGEGCFIFWFTTSRLNSSNELRVSLFFSHVDDCAPGVHRNRLCTSFSPRARE